MEKMFGSIITSSSPLTAILSVLIALFLGLILSFMSFYHSRSSKNFYISTALMPAVASVIILFVNGLIENDTAALASGVAISGAFSLVKFRSAQGNAREIAVIFIAMSVGIMSGAGYVLYAAIFTLILGFALMILTRFNIFERRTSNERMLRIMIPENLDYQNVFDSIFESYLEDCKLLKAKSSNMGSLFNLTYKIKLKNIKDEKIFIDELRTRNGNLEISIEELKEETEL